MKRLLSYFFQGLIYIAPLGVTFFILYTLFIYLDGLFVPLTKKWLNFHIPGLGLILVFLLVAFLGYMGKSIIAQPIKYFTNKLLAKAPLVKVIYSSIKDLLSAFVGKERKFNTPVLVTVNPVSDLEKMGFLTQEDVSHIGIEGKKVAVYFPHSYNFSGEMFIVPAAQVKKINAAASDVMKFIVSGGVTNITLKSDKDDETTSHS
ncbi:MAG: DUF502 domain-containing protein [Bacteroidales bacterium]